MQCGMDKGVFRKPTCETRDRCSLCTDKFHPRQLKKLIYNTGICKDDGGACVCFCLKRALNHTLSGS